MLREGCGRHLAKTKTGCGTRYLVKVGNNVHYPISVLLDVANAIFNALL